MEYFGSERNAVVTVLTDSIDLYGSCLRELAAERGEYTARADVGASSHGL
jgi:hypothetical protein